MPDDAPARKERPQDRVILHHPLLRKQIRRRRRQANVLIRKSGWVMGPLPEQKPAKKTAAGGTAPQGGE
ncbi:MAG: hypothetical protein ACOCUN_00155 [Jiangellaceae bacterium]